MKWITEPRYSGWQVRCGDWFINHLGCVAKDPEAVLGEFTANAYAAFANEHGPWPEGHDKGPKSVDWENADSATIQERVRKSGYTMTSAHHLSTVERACHHFGLQWGRAVGGWFIIHLTDGKPSSNIYACCGSTLAIALCKALDVREGR